MCIIVLLYLTETYICAKKNTTVRLLDNQFINNEKNYLKQFSWKNWSVVLENILIVRFFRVSVLSHFTSTITSEYLIKYL